MLKSANFIFLNVALRNKSQRFLCSECFKSRPWRLLNQTEMKIIRREPNLCNPILAFSHRFETLEGYSVFHRWLCAAAHTHTYYKLLHIAVVTRRSRERFLPALKENPAHSYLILKFPYAPPNPPPSHSVYFPAMTVWWCLAHTGEAVLKSYSTLLAWLVRA